MKIWSDDSPITRRQALAQLGALAGIGLIPGCTSGADAAAGLTHERRHVEGSIIRTLTGDLQPEALGEGTVLMHEHLSMRYPLDATEHFSDDVDLMIEEVRIAAGEGVACIVDAGHSDMARDLDALRRITAESGMPIVASGGYYMQPSYPPELEARRAEEIAEELVREASRDRLGAFGEIGQQGGELTATERKVFAAVGQAQLLSGLPVFTHSPYTGRRQAGVPRDAGLQQLAILCDQGANPAQIAVGHVCCLDDPGAEVAIEIAERGAFVAFDRVTLNAILPDSARVEMALALIEAGHADKLLLSSDLYSARSLKSRGGPGIAQAATVFAPMLRAAGVEESMIRQILEENPRRFLAFVPRA